MRRAGMSGIRLHDDSVVSDDLKSVATSGRKR